MKTRLLLLAISTIGFAVVACPSPRVGYVVHEWGTFTSVQGADGVPLEWNPLTSSELPKFVHDWSKPLPEPRRHLTAFGGKTAFRTLQRMETPVIYFYADEPQTVDVTVQFPQGLVTEWYPQVTEIGPSAVQPRAALTQLDRLVGKAGFQPNPGFASLDTRKGIADSHVRWGGVQIQPRECTVQLPRDASGSHYYAARETGADLLAVPAPANAKVGSDAAEYERFLFYRGIGSFPTPLQVSSAGEEGHVLVRNDGKEALNHLFVLHVSEGKADYAHIKRLAAGEPKSVSLGASGGQSELESLVEDVSGQMAQALIEAGLYPREAKAMVKTWRESWFAEPGTRVMYVLPRPWTDQVLPITLKPAPAELVRVMVGRAELLTPATERAVLNQVQKYSEGGDQDRVEAVKETRRLGLGRFLEPAIQRVAQESQQPKLTKAAWELLAAATRNSTSHDTVAAR